MRQPQTLQLRARAVAFWQFLNGTEGEFRTKVLRSGAWVVVSSMGIRLVEFTRSIILARLLMPEVFGLMGIAAFIVHGLDALTQTGCNDALIHRQERSREVFDTVWAVNIIRGLVLAAAVALAAPYVAVFYEQSLLEGILRVVAVALIVQGFSNVNTMQFNRDLDFKRLALLQQSATLLGTVVVVALAWWLRSVWALALGHLVQAAITAGLSFIVQRQWPRPRFRLELARQLYHYGKFLTGAAIVLFLALEIDNAIAGKLLGMEALGFYVLAYTLANMPATHIAHVVSNVMFPSYSQIQGDRAKLGSVYLKVLNVTAAITVPAAAGLAFLAPEVTGVVYGPKWLPMARALQILCLHGLFWSILAANAPLYKAVGRPRYLFWLNSLRVVLILATIFPLTRAWGIQGTALSVSAAIGVTLVLSLLLVSRVLDLSPAALARALVSPLLGSGLMLAPLAALGRLSPLAGAHPAAGLAAFVLAGIASYAAFLLLFDRSLTQEVRLALGLGRAKG